jgi:peroxiredoxin
MRLLRDRSADFEEAGVRVMAISRDSPYTHVAWAQVLELDFPLLSDWNGEAIEGFDVEQTYVGMRGVAQRSAFLVDEGGTVRGAWRYGTSEVPDADELVEAARALQA